jgi:hypothetical protein
MILRGGVKVKDFDYIAMPFNNLQFYYNHNSETKGVGVVVVPLSLSVSCSLFF